MCLVYRNFCRSTIKVFIIREKVSFTSTSTYLILYWAHFSFNSSKYSTSFLFIGIFNTNRHKGQYGFLFPHPEIAWGYFQNQNTILFPCPGNETELLRVCYILNAARHQTVFHHHREVWNISVKRKIKTPSFYFFCNLM